ncbi:MAG: hypothetical protein CMK59_14345 [Proteobacteria bacterium]|nr:hypothetical protein [Pseudomonadota bacterium]
MSLRRAMALTARRRRHGVSYSMTCTEIQIGAQAECNHQLGLLSFFVQLYVLISLSSVNKISSTYCSLSF